MKTLSIQKVCNALITDQILSELAGEELVVSNHPIAKKIGGLWTAGVFSIDGAWIRFVPKGIEQAPNLKQDGFRIALANVNNVAWKFGLVSGIVVIRHDQGEFRVRCFGARQVVKEIAAYIENKSSY